MGDNEVKDMTGASERVAPSEQAAPSERAAEQKALFMKLLAAKIGAAKRLPLSFSQERIWSITQLNPENTSFNISNSMYIYGAVDEVILEKSLQEMIQRQEILRSIFLAENGRPVQVTLPLFAFKLKIIDAASIASDETALEQTISYERKQAFDLSKDLPFRAVLLKLEPRKYILILIMHQIVIDAESWPIVMGELGSMYQAFRQGTKPALPALSMQYAEYAGWQRERLQGAAYTLLNEWWRDRFQEAIAPLELPADRLPVIQSATRAYSYPFRIGTEVLAKLKQLSGQEKVSLFSALITTFNCLLYMYTQQEHFLIFTSVSAKNRPELKALMGLFSNLVPIQVKIKERQPVRQILESIHREVNDVVAHQDLPFDKITESIKLKALERRVNYNFPFQVMFTFRYADQSDYNLGDIRLEPIEMTLEKEFNFQLRLGMKEMVDHIEGNLTYNAAVFEASTIGQIVENYLVLLESSFNDVDLPLADLPVFQTIERHRELLARERANFAQSRADFAQMGAGQPQVRMAPLKDWSILTESIWNQLQPNLGGPGNLPEPGESPDSGELERGDGTPRNEMETKLVEIWQNVFGIARVGIHDSFFDLGGHSLMAVRIIDQAKQSGLDISFQDILSYKTIARICASLNQGIKTSDAAEFRCESPDVSYACGGEESRRYEMDIPETKILPIKLQNEVTTYLHYFLSLTVVLTDERLAPWFYEHYINIFTCMGPYNFLRFDFLEYEFIRSQFLTSILFNYELLADLPDIIPFLLDKINRGYYAIIHVDEFYLPEKQSYQKRHFVHPSLIYGYHHPNRRLLALGFDQEHLLAKITFDYDQFVEAYENGKDYYQETAPWAEKGALELLRFKNHVTEYPFDLTRFLGRLDDYLAARGDNSVIYHYELHDENVAYGVAVYDEVVRQLKNMFTKDFRMDYLGFHFLAEHKKGIYNRLRYVASRYQAPGDLVKMIDEYYPVVEQFEAIRLKCLEFNYANDSANVANLAKVVKESIELITAIQAKEHPLLSEISRRLKLLP